MWSCSPEARIQRITKKNPHLIQVDTIAIHDTVILDAYIHDTTTILVPHKTVEVVNNEKVRLVYRFDTITREIHHEVECKTDTVIRIHEIPVETIQIQEAKKPTDWKFWGLLVAVVVGFVFMIVIRLKP